MARVAISESEGASGERAARRGPLRGRAARLLGYDRGPSRVLGQLRIRNKLLLLHSAFSVMLAAILLLTVRPALLELVDVAEAAAAPVGGDPVPLPAVRAAAMTLYVFLVVALLFVYGLIVLALEVVVLPRHVYGPIRAMLRADAAVQSGDAARELIPERMMPADELGEIMRSRNASIAALRRSQAALGVTLERLEASAADLKKKNHLLEHAQRNLQGADRLASLGMMSAGIAHELNTPLAVAKGLSEKLAESPGQGLKESEALLLRRVILRLERLSDSLLDFARAREPARRSAVLAALVEEALTLVRLDRAAAGVPLVSAVPPDLILRCDPDRIVQVLVNLVRNGVDSIGRAPTTADERGESGGEVRVTAEASADGSWVTIRITDDGPGIDTELMPRLFEPFVSTRMDDRGTGLGLAVSEGIVREHGGTVIARNRSAEEPGRSGAVFEVVLPRGMGHDEAGRDDSDGASSIEPALDVEPALEIEPAPEPTVEPPLEARP